MTFFFSWLWLTAHSVWSPRGAMTSFHLDSQVALYRFSHRSRITLTVMYDMSLTMFSSLQFGRKTQEEPLTETQIKQTNTQLQYTKWKSPVQLKKIKSKSISRFCCYVNILHTSAGAPTLWLHYSRGFPRVATNYSCRPAIKQIIIACSHSLLDPMFSLSIKNEV